MNKLYKEITELTAEYYKLIGQDHHKDRDCHFDIEHKWSYGEDTGWHVTHYGYINEWSAKFTTEEAALKWMIQKLSGAIKNQKDYFKQEEDIRNDMGRMNEGT